MNDTLSDHAFVSAVASCLRSSRLRVDQYRVQRTCANFARASLRDRGCCEGRLAQATANGAEFRVGPADRATLMANLFGVCGADLWCVPAGI